MIAIAGAKGGCGKTTVTVGLARALSRAGEPTVAVDADRQLPNLHAVADVDRTPTLAALEDDGVDAAVQALSGSSSAGVISAPESSDRIDFELALDRLAREDVGVLLDCPSGGGPDVVEPLEVADAVLVVTTETDRSTHAARTTIEMARRLDVPVAGAVVTRSDGVTGEFESALGVPVLGTIPERRPPLPAEATRAAFDSLAATLSGSRTTTRDEVDGDLLSTGVDALDAALGGGLSAGSVVALTAAPASQSEHLLYDLTETRGTLYLTTDRSRANVERAIAAAPGRLGNPTVRRVAGDDRLSRAGELIGKLPEGANLVVDSMNALERTDRRTYREFLNGLVDRIDEVGGVAICHCLIGEDRPANRSVTTHLVDGVVDLRSYSAGAGAATEHALTISKLRGNRRAAETVSLEFDRPPVDVDSEPIVTG
ncbi:DUF7125 family protein [Natrarchaeobius oligotrophus]|uniref:Chromosome partitioning protein n=1 Tax=Natrarchaeobius chitinivorans TaxID=1679083 RepID=A0A3N6PNY8_NATCH|nr:P-loop NTPase [Natrarchaeobius chitinivorans]RQH03440.1 chromosome partitioning protein [Natrarchaeobius chitinivorans]